MVRREPYRGGGQPVFIDTTSQRYRAYRLQELTDRGVPIERAVQLLLLREKYQETLRDLGGLPAGSKPPLGALLPRLPQPEAKPSALNASLVATAPGLGGDSFAIIEDGVDGTQKRYRLGDKFQDRTLASVGWNRVVLRSGDHDEFLQLLARPEGRELLPLLGVVAGAPRTPRAAIQPNSEFEFAIDRAEVDRSTEHTNELFTQIRAVPHFQDGQAAGFRVLRSDRARSSIASASRTATSSPRSTAATSRTPLARCC